MNKFVIKLLNKWGYLAVFFLIIIENIFPPIPSEVILLFSGALTSMSNLNTLFLIVISSIASLLGALLLYLIGYKLGIDRIRKIVEGKIGKITGLKVKDVDRAKMWFDKHEAKAVFFCRFVPLVRSLISIPAGINKMNILLFSIYSFVGSAIWNSALIMLGKLFSNNWESILLLFKRYSIIILLLMILGVVILLVKRKFKKI